MGTALREKCPGTAQTAHRVGETVRQHCDSPGAFEDTPDGSESRGPEARKARVSTAEPGTDASLLVSALSSVSASERRTWRHKARRTIAEWSEQGFLDRAGARYCWTPSGAGVQVAVAGEGISHVSGIRRCGSPWACPCCAPVIGERRAVEVDQLIRAILDSGGHAVFVTLTVPHGASMRLRHTLATVYSAWRRVLQGRAAQAWKASSGFLGLTRVVEVTHGANGWHPHLHAVLFFDRPVTTTGVHAWLYPRWADAVTAAGLSRPSARYGCDVRAVTAGSDALAKYLTKVEGSDWTAGRELARADTKTGRWKGRTPTQILAGAVAGDVGDRALWCEFDTATRGRRRLETTHGLRAAYALDDEASDDDAAIEAAPAAPLAVVMVPSALWRWWDERHAIGLLLAAIERDVIAGFTRDLWDEAPP